MPASSRRARRSLFALGSLLLSASCASTTYEHSPPPASVTSEPVVRASVPETPVPATPVPDDGGEPVPDTTGFTYHKQDIEAWPRHRAWLYVGDALTSEGGALTLGLRYGYFAYGNVGFGIVGDYSDRDLETWILAAAVFVRPTKHFQITVAPGFEFVDGDNEPMIRTGFEYAFPISEHLAIMPGISADIVSNNANATNLGLSLQGSF